MQSPYIGAYVAVSAASEMNPRVRVWYTRVCMEYLWPRVGRQQLRVISAQSGLSMHRLSLIGERRIDVSLNPASYTLVLLKSWARVNYPQPCLRFWLQVFATVSLKHTQLLVSIVYICYIRNCNHSLFQINWYDSAQKQSYWPAELIIHVILGSGFRFRDRSEFHGA